MWSLDGFGCRGRCVVVNGLSSASPGRPTATGGALQQVSLPQPDSARFLVQEVQFLEAEPQWVSHQILSSSGAIGALPPTVLTPGPSVQMVQTHAPTGVHVLRWG